MDGRQILDGMNDDVIFGIYNGQAPWQRDVPEKYMREAPSLAMLKGAVEGIASLQLDCLANRFGYSSVGWSPKRFAEDGTIKVSEDVRFFATLDPLFEFERRSGQYRVELIPSVVFNEDCAIGEKYPSEPHFHHADTIALHRSKPELASMTHDPLIGDDWEPALPVFIELLERQELDGDDRDAMLAGIFDLVKGQGRTAEFATKFDVNDDQAQAVCRNLVTYRISSACGYGWRSEDAVLIDPDAVAAAVKTDPFWLARICREAEIRQAGLLHPTSFNRVYGSAARYREVFEQSFDQMKSEEKRQYLIVPFEDNAEARAKGARFDRVAKAWYVPPGRDINDFARWDRPSDLSPEAEFADVMRHHGLLVEGDAIMDGQPHRVMLEGQRPGSSPAGSYKGYLDGRPAGHFTNFRDGDGKAVKWVASGHRVDPALRSETARQIEVKREARRRELEARRAQAALESKVRWDAAEPVDRSRGNRYLDVKCVDGYGVRVDGTNGQLLVPLRDENADIVSLQSIGRNRDDLGFHKRFTAGARKQGAFHLIHRHGLPKHIFRYDDPYLVEGGLRQLRMAPHVTFIAEGYATAASVHEATGRPVVVAFDAHNLKPVAELFRNRIIRDRPLVFVADDDHQLKRNVGVEAAIEAARTVRGAHVIVPTFDEKALSAGLTDFNDLHRHAGIEAVSRQLHAAIAPIFRDFRVRQMGTDADKVRVFQSDEVAPRLTPKWERIMVETLGESGGRQSGRSR